MSKPRITLTVPELERDTDNRVYVVNQTAGHEKGQVIIIVPKLNSTGEDTVVIPSTFVPIDITEQISKQQLLAGSEFRNAIRSQSLAIVRPDYAEKVLATEKAQREVMRLAKERNQRMQSVTDISSLLDEHNVLDPAIDPNAVDEGPKQTENYGAIAQTMLTLEETKDEESAIATLENIDGLVKDDYKYVYKEAKQNKFKLVKEWAREGAGRRKKSSKSSSSKKSSKKKSSK